MKIIFPAPSLLPARCPRSIPPVGAFLPRKNYDLKNEISVFVASESKLLLKVSQSTDWETLCDWVERSFEHPVGFVCDEDGFFRFGRGPEAKHSLMASIEAGCEEHAYPFSCEMKGVRSAGEAFLDQGNLVLINKSGHYRPSYQSLVNSGIKEFFQEQSVKFGREVPWEKVILLEHRKSKLLNAERSLRSQG